MDGDSYHFITRWRVRGRCERVADVLENEPFMRRFGRFLRPLFAANHNWTMRRGLTGLRRELGAADVQSSR
jgi:hypothetical protein